MRLPNPLRVLLGLALVTTYGDAVAANGPLVAGPGVPGAVVVVELYTSEGCSSCPPADDVLAAVQAQAQSAGATVLTAGFHVDYWDRIGWKDPYSDAAFTDRQALRGGDRLYTPQMVVNGDVSFVGSDADKARDALAVALKRPASVQPRLEVRRTGANLTVDVRLDAIPSSSRVVVVLVEEGLSTAVPLGENAGRTLNHTSVVRGYARGLAASRTRHILTLPASLQMSRARVLAWVEDSRTLAVLGGTSAALPHTDR